MHNETVAQKGAGCAFARVHLQHNNNTLAWRSGSLAMAVTGAARTARRVRGCSGPHFPVWPQERYQDSTPKQSRVVYTTFIPVFHTTLGSPKTGSAEGLRGSAGVRSGPEWLVNSPERGILSCRDTNIYSIRCGWSTQPFY